LAKAKLKIYKQEINYKFSLKDQGVEWGIILKLILKK
jgi:hypothetical protein